MIRLRQSSKKPVRRAPILLLAILTGMSGMTCDLPPSFGPEYDDKTTNYIRNFPLAAPSVTTNASLETALDQPAVWDWAWRGQTNNMYPYMTLTDAGTVGTAVTSGTNILANDEKAWRLELANLVINPSFQGVLGSSWSESTGGILSRTTISAISGNSVFINTPSTASFAAVDSTFFLDEDAFEHSYQIWFNAINGDAVKYEEAMSYASKNLQPPVASESGRYLIPTPISGFSNISGKKMFFSASSLFVLDDLHAIRTDVGTIRWSLKLRLKALDTAPEPALVPGLYEFSIWVKKPETSYFPTETGREDSPDCAATDITLRIIGIEETERELAVETYPMESLDTGWNRLALRITDRNKALNFSEALDKGQVLAVSISPSNRQYPGAGAVLIASPSLNYYRNGF